MLGTVNKNTFWIQVNVSPNVITYVDTNPQKWVQFALFNYSANELIYATSNSTLGTVVVGDNGVLTSSASGVPSWLSAGPNEVLVSTGSDVPQWSTALPSNTTINGPFTNNSQIVNKAYVDAHTGQASTKVSLPIVTAQVSVSSAQITQIGGYFCWFNAEYYMVTGTGVFYEATVPNGNSLTISIYNETTDPNHTSPLGTQTLTGPVLSGFGFNSFSFVAPGGTSGFSGYIGSSLGTVANTVLTVTSWLSGSIAVGQVITGTGVALYTYVTEQLSGTPGQIGTYNVSISQAVMPQTLGGIGANARLSICVNKTIPGGQSPSIYGVTVILNPST
jgi:hypothetical protein